MSYRELEDAEVVAMSTFGRENPGGNEMHHKLGHPQSSPPISWRFGQPLYKLLAFLRKVRSFYILLEAPPSPKVSLRQTFNDKVWLSILELCNAYPVQLPSS
jgi:hypothetical protein